MRILNEILRKPFVYLRGAFDYDEISRAEEINWKMDGQKVVWARRRTNKGL